MDRLSSSVVIIIIIIIGNRQRRVWSCECIVPPSIVNISRDVRTNVSSDVILQCSAAGTPHPNITWYKVSGDVEKSNS